MLIKIDQKIIKHEFDMALSWYGFGQNADDKEKVEKPLMGGHSDLPSPHDRRLWL